jgi:hypothetical protein
MNAALTLRRSQNIDNTIPNSSQAENVIPHFLSLITRLRLHHVSGLDVNTLNRDTRPNGGNRWLNCYILTELVSTPPAEMIPEVPVQAALLTVMLGSPDTTR